MIPSIAELIVDTAPRGDSTVSAALPTLEYTDGYTVKETLDTRFLILATHALPSPIGPPIPPHHDPAERHSFARPRCSHIRHPILLLGYKQ
jgi:hypothetical protein